MSKKYKTPIGILTESVGLYFSNFTQFIKYMSFPVWGQLAGLGLILAITNLYVQNLPKLIERFPNLNSTKTLVLMTIIITLPGLLIYLKAFWNYLVSYGAINSMLDNMLKSGRVYDFEAHNELVKQRIPTFVGIWFLLSIFTLAAVFPLFWVIGGIFGIYFILVFQVFTFEQNLNSWKCFKRSLHLILRHFASTFVLLLFIGGLTYFIIPQLIIKGFDGIGFSSVVAEWIKPLLNKLPLIEIPGFGVITDFQLSTILLQSVVAQIIIQYTLPLRSILWSLWYKELSNNYEPAIKKEKKSRKKRPSEKLMEKSHQKYGTKKLDTNILRRATEKDED